MVDRHIDNRVFDDGTRMNSQAERVIEGESGGVENNAHYSNQTGHLMRGIAARTARFIEQNFILPVPFSPRGLPLDHARNYRRYMRRIPIDGRR